MAGTDPLPGFKEQFDTMKSAVQGMLGDLTAFVERRFADFEREIVNKGKEIEGLKLRLEISQCELKAMHEYLSSVDEKKKTSAGLNEEEEEQGEKDNGQGKEASSDTTDPVEEAPRVRAELQKQLRMLRGEGAVKDSDKTKSQRSNSHLTAEIPEKIQRVTHNGTPDVSLERPEQRARGIYRADNSLPSESGTKSELVTVYLDKEYKRVEDKAPKPHFLLEMQALSENPSTVAPFMENMLGTCSEKEFQPKDELVDKPQLENTNLQEPLSKGNRNKQRSDSEERKFECQECRKRFKTSEILRRHKQSHTGEKPFHCDKCNGRFTRLSHLKKHQTAHIYGKMFSCFQCGKWLKTAETLRKHQKIHMEEQSSVKPQPKSEVPSVSESPPKNPDPQEWPTSGLSSEVADAEISSPPEEKPVLPVEKPHERMDCEETGTVKQGRKKSHKVERQFLCSHCGKHFRYLYALKRHDLVHTGKKPFPCPECGRGFRCNSDLKRHQKTHIGQKPYTCPNCSKDFLKMSHLQEHLLTHKSETE
ncbi:zinc finger protein 585A-like [Erpetoichthys calabaricus]|uniref:Zinc finger protein 585A-like n=1 Tax=Erpetoichthys calabaricus TaxID=27687 RepID=A0A8C4S7Y6_ERPCA|nr:zinc finger protein 585A-like [Erpetoichthys calabaricus]